MGFTKTPTLSGILVTLSGTQCEPHVTGFSQWELAGVGLLEVYDGLGVAGVEGVQVGED